MRYSVIVCTFNRSGLLEDTLRQLELQDLPADKYEVIVVDNNSTDNTREIAEQFTSRTANFQYVFEPIQGVSRARNRGYEEAKGEYLVYVDDDVLVEKGHLSAVDSVVTRFDPDIIGGPLYPQYMDSKPKWFKDSYETRWHGDESRFSTTCRVNGGNAVIRRTVLESVGLYDTQISFAGTNRSSMGEDAKVLDTYRRQVPLDKQKVYYSVEATVHHKITGFKMTRGYVLKRGYALGKMERNLVVARQRPGIYRIGRSFAGDLRRNFCGFTRDLGALGPFRADYMILAYELSRTAGRLRESLGHLKGH